MDADTMDQVSDPGEWQLYHHGCGSSSDDSDPQADNQQDIGVRVSTLRRRALCAYHRQLIYAEERSDQEEIWRIQGLIDEATLW